MNHGEANFRVELPISSRPADHRVLRGIAMHSTSRSWYLCVKRKKFSGVIAPKRGRQIIIIISHGNWSHPTGSYNNKKQEMLVHEVKTSSRVTAPPGGCSSISLSFAPHNKDEKVKTRVNARSKEADYSQYEEEHAKEGEKRVTTTGVFKISPQTVGHSRSSPCTSSNAYASGSRMNSGNVLTGRPTSRVLAPPGGRSSFRLGWRDIRYGANTSILAMELRTLLCVCKQHKQVPNKNGL